MPTIPIFDTFLFTAVNGSTTGTLGAHLRVIYDSSGGLVLASNIQNAIGHLTERGAKEAEPATVRGATAPEQRAIASEAIAVGDTVFAAASGKVSGTNGGSDKVLGQARTASAADGDQIAYTRTDGQG